MLKLIDTRRPAMRPECCEGCYHKHRSECPTHGGTRLLVCNYEKIELPEATPTYSEYKTNHIFKAVQ